MNRPGVLATLALLALPICSAELQRLEVSRDKSVINVQALLHIKAPMQQVYSALRNYEDLSRVSERFREARIEEVLADGSERVYSRVEGCVLFFCRQVERYALLKGNGSDRLEAIVELEGSDFDYGYEQWQLTSVEGGTLVEYRHEFRAKFWVPPIIGVWAIKRELRDDAMKAAQHIEDLAAANEQRGSAAEENNEG